MGIEFNFDEDEFRNTIADAVEEMFIEYVENEAGNGDLECECGSGTFDVETWKNSNGGYEGAAICRDCNERLTLNIDTSDTDDLR
jgi:hypothetical protein